MKILNFLSRDSKRKYEKDQQHVQKALPDEIRHGFRR